MMLETNLTVADSAIGNTSSDVALAAGILSYVRMCVEAVLPKNWGACA